MKPRKANPVLTSDHGIATIHAIADEHDLYRVYPIRLHDGDEVAVTGEIAKGILLIRNALKPVNRDRLNKMTLLELLHIYSEAVKDGVLRPSSLRLHKTEDK